jgi:EAL domain-containing protein (putative c-di-GMP-specific phosphodiesterase class I)
MFEAIVNMGHVLSLVTVAEGIENPGQLKTARELGCDLAQGYLLGRPLPPEAAQRLVMQRSGAPLATEARDLLLS